MYRQTRTETFEPMLMAPTPRCWLRPSHTGQTSREIGSQLYVTVGANSRDSARLIYILLVLQSPFSFKLFTKVATPIQTYIAQKIVPKSAIGNL